MKLLQKIRLNQIAISLLIGFALGVVYGNWYTRENFHSRWKHGSMSQRMVERFSRELHLSSDQKKEVTAIFEAKRPQMVALQAEMKPKFEALRNSTQEEIRKILNPDQQKKLDELNAKMEERWKEREKFFNS